MSKLTPEQVHEAQSETELEIRNYYKEKCKKQELIWFQILGVGYVEMDFKCF